MIEIPGGGSKDYMLTYHPLVMTDGESEDESKHKHKGSIFFPLPSGEALPFNLINIDLSLGTLNSQPGRHTGPSS